MSIPANGVIYGHPVDDPGCNLWWIERVPDPALWGPGPYPAVCLFPAGGFRSANPTGTLATANDLATAGFIAFACTNRCLVQKIDGQTTTGQYEQQEDDCRTACQAARSDPRCIPTRIYGLGGSAGGCLVSEVCSNGAVRFNAGAAFSGAFNFAERRPENYVADDGSDVTLNFAQLVSDYVGTTDLTTLLNSSPVSHLQSDIVPFMFFSSDEDNMPFWQYLDMVAAMGALNPPHWASDHTPGRLHAFNAWPIWKDRVIAFLRDPTSIGGGGEPPPPDPTSGFRLTLSGGPYHIVEATASGLLPFEARAATIINLTPQTNYHAELVAFTPAGDSDPATYDFTSDPGDLKPIMCGAIHLLSASGGDFWTGLASEASLAYAHIKGFRGRTGVNQVIPTTGGVYDWTGIDSALATLTAAGLGQKLGLSIAVGVNANDAWYDAGGPTEVAKIAIDLADITPQAYQPVFWDPAHLLKMQALANATGAKYDGDARVGYIVVSGFMQNNEAYVSKTDIDDAKWDQAALDFGYANKNEAYADAAHKIIGYYLAAFPNTTIYWTTSKVWKGTDGNTAKSDLESWIQNNTAHRCGIMKATLHASAPPYDPPNQVPYPKGSQAISASTDTARYYGNNAPDPYPSAPQLAADMLNAAATQGDTFCEIYNTEARDNTNAAVTAAANLLLCANIPA